MLSDDMAENLDQYIIWASQRDPLKTYFPSINCIERLRSKSGSLSISDDEARWIDRALCKLMVEAPDEFELLRLIYRRDTGEKKSLRWLEQHGHGSRNVNARKLDSALNFIKGFIAAVGS